MIVFRTTYLDAYTGEEIFYAKLIAVNYLKGRFIIDLLATIPFDTFAEAMIGNKNVYLQLFGILKLIRITRLSKIISYLNAKEDLKLGLKLVKLVFFLCIYLHLLGCSWYYLVKLKRDWIPPLDYVYVTSQYFQKDISYQYWM